ncbi:MAG: phospholipid carrier-dependent glycosyltransferase, partial [Planctomycetota bacterium]
MAMGDGTGESAAEREEHRAAPGRWTGADIAALVGLTALAALLRLLFVEQWSYGPTEGETWRLVSSPLADSLAAEDARSHPLYYLLLRQLLEQGVLAGATEGWLRLPSVFAGCLTAPLVALAARPLLGRAAAMLAALVVAVHPACVEAGQTAAPAAFATLFAVLAGALVGRGWRTAGVAA